MLTLCPFSLLVSRVQWRPSVQPSYRRDYYTPEAEQVRYHHHHQQQQHHLVPTMVDDQRDPAPPKAAMSISSLLDSGRAASPPVAITAASPLDRDVVGQRYVSPQYKQEYQPLPRMYSASPPISPEERRSGAPITSLLGDGEARRPIAIAVSSVLLVSPQCPLLTDSSLASSSSAG